jgi:hypothetical protein
VAANHTPILWSVPVGLDLHNAAVVVGGAVQDDQTQRHGRHLREGDLDAQIADCEAARGGGCGGDNRQGGGRRGGGCRDDGGQRGGGCGGERGGRDERPRQLALT